MEMGCWEGTKWLELRESSWGWDWDLEHTTDDMPSKQSWRRPKIVWGWIWNWRGQELEEELSLHDDAIANTNCIFQKLIRTQQ